MTRKAVMRAEEILSVVGYLVDAWCERRCLVALRHALGGYPLDAPTADGWRKLLDALRETAASARAELTADELESLDRLAGAVEVWSARRT